MVFLTEAITKTGWKKQETASSPVTPNVRFVAASGCLVSRTNLADDGMFLGVLGEQDTLVCVPWPKAFDIGAVTQGLLFYAEAVRQTSLVLGGGLGLGGQEQSPACHILFEVASPFVSGLTLKVYFELIFITVTLSLLWFWGWIMNSGFGIKLWLVRWLLLLQLWLPLRVPGV